MNKQIDNQDIPAESTAVTDNMPEMFLDESLSWLTQSWQINAENIDVSQPVLAIIARELANPPLNAQELASMPYEFAPFLRDDLTDSLTFTKDQEKRLAQAVEMGESWGKLVLVNSSRGYVQTIVNKYLKHGVGPETLMVAAMIAVSEAADRFNFSRELPFYSCASFAVRHALSRVVEFHKDQAINRVVYGSTETPRVREIPPSALKKHEVETRVPYINLKTHKSESEALKVLNRELAWKHRVLPIRIEGNRLWVAMKDPRDVATVDEVRFATKCLVQPMTAIASRLDEAILEAYGPPDTPQPPDSPTAIAAPTPESGDETTRMLREALLEMRGMRDELSSLRREISELRHERTGMVPRPSTARLFPFAPPESALRRTG